MRSSPRSTVARLSLVCALATVIGFGNATAGGSAQRTGGTARSRLFLRTVLLGRSVRGRWLRALELGAPSSTLKVVVIGCIDGNECAGIAIVGALAAHRPVAGVDLWLVENMNPDGFAAATLQNADGVDLNRNFPWQWRRLGSRGYRQYSGPRPLSEPESRVIYALLLRLRPRLVVWYHQPLGLVDESGGRLGLERLYARLVGLPLVRLPRYPGSATSWANERFAGATSFVVELPPGPLGATAAQHHAAAVLALVRTLAASG